MDDPEQCLLESSTGIVSQGDAAPFNDVFVCGVSTQVHQIVNGFDELIQPGDADFDTSGLIAASICRLGYLATIPRARIKGRIGEIAPTRLKRLLNNLADYLRP